MCATGRKGGGGERDGMGLGRGEREGDLCTNKLYRRSFQPILSEDFMEIIDALEEIVHIYWHLL